MVVGGWSDGRSEDVEVRPRQSASRDVPYVVANLLLDDDEDYDHDELEEDADEDDLDQSGDVVETSSSSSSVVDDYSSPYLDAVMRDNDDRQPSSYSVVRPRPTSPGALRQPPVERWPIHTARHDAVSPSSRVASAGVNLIGDSLRE